MTESISSSIERKNNGGGKITEIGKQFDTLWRWPFFSLLNRSKMNGLKKKLMKMVKIGESP